MGVTVIQCYDVERSRNIASTSGRIETKKSQQPTIWSATWLASAMQTTRSRRYDDPVEDQPAEDPPPIDKSPFSRTERTK